MSVEVDELGRGRGVEGSYVLLQRKRSTMANATDMDAMIAKSAVNRRLSASAGGGGGAGISRRLGLNLNCTDRDNSRTSGFDKTDVRAMPASVIS